MMLRDSAAELKVLELIRNVKGERVAARRSGRRKRAMSLGIILSLGILVLMVAAGIAGFTLDWDRVFSIGEFVNTMRSWGIWGVFGSIGLMVLHSFVPIPAELLAIANGMIYGAFWGTVITWTGAMLGAVIAFGLARKLGRPFVARMVAERDWEVVDDWAARKGWQIALVGRFIPVIAFNLINWGAGLTRLSWWQFIWTTGLGILPLTILMVVMGENIESFGWKSWLILLICGSSLWIVVRQKFKKQGTSS